MTSIPASFLDDLRGRTSLSAVVGRFVPLARAGNELRACCPFHKEKTPSFHVNDHKGFFHCFGCGAHGDVISFLMRQAGLSFIEAVTELATAAGMSMPATGPRDRGEEDRTRRLLEVMEAAARFFCAAMNEAPGKAARDYLADRGVLPAEIEGFRLGYAPVDGQALVRHLGSLGFAVADMVEAGIVRAEAGGENGERQRPSWAFLRHRIVFPIMDRRGRVIAFGGRLLAGDGPKYINTPETLLFQKGRLLYNLAPAREKGRSGRPLVVAEGYLDVIAMVRVGVDTAVAPLGTALTQAQLEELWAAQPHVSARRPVLCFDGDPAGRRAAFRAAERILPLLRPGYSARFAFLPEGRDPDDLIRIEGAAAMHRALEAAVSLSDVVWMMEAEGRNFDGPEDLAEFKAAVEARVRTIADRDIQGFYRRDMANRLSQLLQRHRDRMVVPRPARRSASANSHWRSRPWAKPILAANPPSQLHVARKLKHERLLLAVVLNHPSIFVSIGDRLGLLEIADGPIERLRQDLVDLLALDPGLGCDDLVIRLGVRGHARTLETLLSPEERATASFVLSSASDTHALAGWNDLWRIGWLRSRGLRELAAAGRMTEDQVTERSIRRIGILSAEAAGTVCPQDEEFLPTVRALSRGPVVGDGGE